MGKTIQFMVICYDSPQKQMQARKCQKEHGIQLVANFLSSQFCFAMLCPCAELPANCDPKVLPLS